MTDAKLTKLRRAAAKADRTELAAAQARDELAAALKAANADYSVRALADVIGKSPTATQVLLKRGRGEA